MPLTKSGGGLGKQIERFDEKYMAWNQVIDPSFDAKSNVWFQNLRLTPIGEYLIDRDETSRTMVQIEHWLDDFFKPEEILMIDDLVQRDIELIGTPISIESSNFGQKIIEALNNAQIQWRYAALYEPENENWPLSSWVEADLPANDTSKIEIYYRNDEQFSVLQYLQIRKDKRGNETAIWFMPQIVASRPMHQITKWYVNNSQTGALEFDEVPPSDLGKVMNFGEWSEQIVLPILFKKLFALAEMGSIDATEYENRADRFSQHNSANTPKPILYFEEFGKSAGTWETDDGVSIYFLQEFPHVANQGWLFKDSDASSLEKTFKIFFEGLKLVQYVLANGFKNNFRKDWSGSWDRYTLSATLMIAREQKQIVNGAGFWCPTLVAALESAITAGDYNAANSDGDASAEEDFKVWSRLTDTGMGPTVTAAINSLVFSHLLKDHEFELASRLLEIGHLMKVPSESWNCLSNWGIVLYMMNDLDGAEEKFDQVFSGPVNLNHDEAYAYKAAIARLRGDMEAAERYQALCEEAGGYDNPIFEQSSIKAVNPDDFTYSIEYDDVENISSGLTKNSFSGLGTSTSDSQRDSSSSTNGSRANFCGECGNMYSDASQNFCSECGTKRQ